MHGKFPKSIIISQFNYTKNNKQYVAFKNCKLKKAESGIRYITFKIQAKNDACISLFAEDLRPYVGGNVLVQGKNYYEIVVGGWKNSKSVLRKDGKQVAECKSKGELNLKNCRTFTIAVKKNGTISLHRGKSFKKDCMLEYLDDEEPINPTHFAVMTGWGSDGYWKW